MRPFPIVAIASFAAFTACSTAPKDEDIEDFYERNLVLPSEELAKKSGTPLKELHIGFGVYVRECGTCHRHIFPDEITGKDWHAITPSMAWNANITDKEQNALTKYILAAKTDPSQLEKQLKHMETLSP
jgi:hypothetical protein